MALSVTALAPRGAMERAVPHLPNVMALVLLDVGGGKGQQAACATVCVLLAGSAQQEHVLGLRYVMERAQREGELFCVKYRYPATLFLPSSPSTLSRHFCCCTMSVTHAQTICSICTNDVHSCRYSDEAADVWDPVQ